MKGRALLAIGILTAWIGGLGMLVREEYFRPRIERLAEAALRVTPDAVFYAVMQGDRQVGFASSTLDTATTTIELRDYLVADIPLDGGVHRAEVRTNVLLTRALRVTGFDVEMDTDRRPVKVTGEILGDTVIRVAVSRAGARPDTQYVPTAGAILLPTLVPLAVALSERPEIGGSVTFPVFDPLAVATREVRVDVRAESLFVVNDSSVFDSTAGRWKDALPDTVRGWQLVSAGGSGIGGWVDEQGRLIMSSQLGFQLQRRPYEVAFENWRMDTDTVRRAATARAPVSGNVVPTTLIGAGLRAPAGAPLAEFRVRLSGGSPALALRGGRQRMSGDTLIVTREDATALAPRYIAIRNARERAGNADLQDEEFLEVDHREIRSLAERLSSFSRNPRNVAMRIHEWVRDSLRKEPVAGIPSALHVLHTRRGDANEHAQLYVALARAAGVPARVATGVVYVNGRFYQHAWPEVMLRGWVAVDPLLDQFPADAARIRLATGGVARQNEVLRALETLRLDVVRSR